MKPKLLLLLLVCVSCAGGCAGLTFRKIPLGAGPREYRAALPAEESRTTALGRCCLLTDSGGGVAAIVLLLNDERRVAGKLLAESAGRDARLRGAPAFELSGEIDRRMYGVAEVTAADVLRLVRSELLEAGGERLVREAHGRVAVGLERLLMSLPEPVAEETLLADAGADAVELADLRARIAGGGEGQVGSEGDRLTVSYTVR